MKRKVASIQVVNGSVTTIQLFPSPIIIERALRTGLRKFPSSHAIAKKDLRAFSSNEYEVEDSFNGTTLGRISLNFAI